MTLSCINSNAVDLYYYRYAPSKQYAVVSQFPTEQNSRTYYAGSELEKEGEKVIWEIEEDKTKRGFSVEANYSYSSSNHGGDEYDVVTRYNAFFDAKGFEILTDEDKHFYAVIYPDENSNRQPQESRFFRFTNGKYTNGNAYDFSHLSSQQNPENYTSKIEEERLVRLNIPATWAVNFYKDGLFTKAIETQAYKDSPFVFSPDVIEKFEVDHWIWTTETVSKKSGSEAIEALPNPDVSYQTQVWLVTLDEKGEEKEREVIRTIDNKEDREAPTVYLVCKDVDSCLENEYQLDCDTHLCCYKLDGTATKRIDK